MASEQEGLLHQKKIFIQRLNYLRKEYAITSDANQRFTLQMQIEEVEKEIQLIDAKINNSDKGPSTDSTNISKTTIENKKSYRKLIINIMITIITVLAALMGFVKDFRDFFFPPILNQPETIITKDSTDFDTSKTLDIIDSPIIKNPPAAPIPLKKEVVTERYISVRLIVDIIYEKASIFANNIQVYPINNAPLIKELNIKYEGKPIELTIKIPEKTCTHHITVSDNYFNNPKTIEKICAQ